MLHARRSVVRFANANAHGVYTQGFAIGGVKLCKEGKTKGVGQVTEEPDVIRDVDSIDYTYLYP